MQGNNKYLLRISSVNYYLCGLSFHNIISLLICVITCCLQSIGISHEKIILVGPPPCDESRFCQNLKG